VRDRPGPGRAAGARRGSPWHAVLRGVLGALRRAVRGVIPERVRLAAYRVWLVRFLRQWVRVRLLLRPLLRRQLASREGPSAPVSASAPRVLVPLIQSSHYQAFHILALAKALQLRGAAVKVLLCHSVLDGCEIKNIRATGSDPCLNCRMNARSLLPLYGLELVRLSDLVGTGHLAELRAIAREVAASYPAAYEHRSVDIIPMTDASVTRHCYGAVTSLDASAVKSLRERYLFSALVGVEAAAAIEADWDPQLLASDMSVYCDWAPYLEYYRNRGVPYHTISLSPFGYHEVMVDYEDFYRGSERFERWRSTRSSPYLEPAEDRELQAKLTARFGGESLEADSGAFAGSATVTDLGLDPDKRNLFLFSNLYWDIGIDYDHALYHDVVSWVIDSIRLVQGQSDTHLFIKPHPAEVFGSSASMKGVVDFVAEAFPELPANVTIIAPELRLRTYDLFPHIDVGLVYNGTVGLEMLLHGIPVVTCGAAPYGGHGLTSEPETVEEYSDLLAGRAELARPAPELTRLFAYFYFIKAQIPWRLTERALADDFKGYTFQDLDGLRPGADPYLDHLCDHLLGSGDGVLEAWGPSVGAA
jgi:hypothetical protein